VKIAWFTPFSKRSAIARCSHAIVTELAKHATVDLWHAEPEDARATEVRTIRFSQSPEVDLATLAAYDLVVYNFGNYLPFHREIFHVSQRFPGLCVLHDFVMHHFFAEYYFEDLKNPQAYVLAMHRLYGAQGKSAAEEMLAGKGKRVWETDEVVAYPFFEEVIRGAYGVITHSDFFREKVQKSYPGPVRKIYLPYDLGIDGPTATRAELGVPEESILMVTVGHVNPNKRIHAVIDALGHSAGIAQKVTYAVLGPYDKGYYSTLMEAVKQHGLEASVRFLGYVPDDVLRAYITRADICINLRFPAIEGASASAIEEMLHGKPVVVTNTGFYGELPDDCVRKVEPEREEEELAVALRQLVTDREARERMGERARNFAEEHFRAEVYVKEFLQFSSEVGNARPLFQLADRLAAELNQMGVSRGMEIVETVSQECHRLFCAEA